MAPHCILVVEPHALNRMVLSEQLTTLGHAPLCAEDGEHALVLLATRLVDAALIACRMPGMDGFALAARVRDDARRRGVRALAMIGCTNTLDVDATLATQSGMRACLAMPATTRALDDALRSALSAAGDAEAVASAQWPLFARTTHNDLSTVRDALLQGDRATTRDVLHRIKGAASMIGANAIARACADGEAAVVAGADAATVSRAIDALEARLVAAPIDQARR